MHLHEEVEREMLSGSAIASAAAAPRHALAKNFNVAMYFVVLPAALLYKRAMLLI